jgi:SAM-dependent methyltransferase
LQTIECETERIAAIYRLRATDETNARYLYTERAIYMTVQEKERALIHWIRSCGILPVVDKKVLEVGCGSGVNRLWFLRAGFRPENLVGNELLQDRAAIARRNLPAGCELHLSDALKLDLPSSQFHIVLQSTVFSSILDEKFQADLAARMWSWVKPGGGVLWYDVAYNNPRNPNVRGIRLNRIRELFSAGRMRYWRVTLAPPISRLVTRVHPSLYTLFNAVPALRSHVLCWIEKS